MWSSALACALAGCGAVIYTPSFLCSVEAGVWRIPGKLVLNASIEGIRALYTDFT